MTLAAPPLVRKAARDTREEEKESATVRKTERKKRSSDRTQNACTCPVLPLSPPRPLFLPPPPLPEQDASCGFCLAARRRCRGKAQRRVQRRKKKKRRESIVGSFRSFFFFLLPSFDSAIAQCAAGRPAALRGGPKGGCAFCGPASALKEEDRASGERESEIALNM